MGSFYSGTMNKKVQWGILGAATIAVEQVIPTKLKVSNFR